MKIIISQALLLWYGSIILGTFSYCLGSEYEQTFLMVFSFIQFMFVLFLILGSEDGRLVIKKWKHIIIGIIIFIISIFIWINLFEGLGKSSPWWR